VHITIIDRDTDGPKFPHDLVKYLKAGGATVEAISPAEVGIVAEGESAIVTFGGKKANTNIVVTRQVSLLNDLLRIALPLLEADGVWVCNPTVAASLAQDKVATSIRLAQAGVASVPTIGVACAPASLTLSTLEQFQDKGRLVVKPAVSGGGVGVRLSQDYRDAANIIELISNQLDFNNQEVVIASSRHYVVQPYMGEGIDARVFIVDGEALAMTRRVASPTDFRTNGAYGGVDEKWWDDASAELAIAATEAIGLQYSGVDVIPTADGPYILEVNGWPGYAHTAAVTGIDLAKIFAQYLLQGK
jgi:ribosomal protein S6--L-glutamate ligase